MYALFSHKHKLNLDELNLISTHSFGGTAALGNLEHLKDINLCMPSVVKGYGTTEDSLTYKFHSQ